MLRTLLKLVPLLALAASAPALAQNPYNVRERVVYVSEGQTLDELVRALFPDQRRYWPDIVEAFGNLNPEARRPQLPAGVRLQVPDALRRVAVVSELSGEARASSFLRAPRSLRAGDEIYLAERVVTAPGSHLRLSAVDDAQLLLRPESDLRIVEYAFREGARDNSSFMQLVRGGLRAITGRIGRDTPQRYRVATRLVTIGVRGTDYGVRVCGKGECPVVAGLDVKAAPGVYVAVLEGEVELRNQATRQRIGRGDYYYVAARDRPGLKLYEQPRLVFSEQEMAGLRESAPQPARRALSAGPLLVLLLAGVAWRRRRFS